MPWSHVRRVWDLINSANTFRWLLLMTVLTGVVCIISGVVNTSVVNGAMTHEASENWHAVLYMILGGVYALSCRSIIRDY